MDHFEKPTDTLHTRRQFLRTSMLGAAAAWTLPLFLEKTFLAMDAEAADSATQTINGKDGPILVVLQMAGGNDGLNTLVPHGDDAYYRARRRIAIAAADTLKIDGYVGLHPALTGLKGLYDDGHLSIVQGVGYPNPNRSHFRSTEIWQTAADAENLKLTDGWLGRYFDACCQGADPTVGVSIGSARPQAFNSLVPTGVSLANPEQYRWVAEDEADEAFRALNRPSQDPLATGVNAGDSIGAIPGDAPGEMGALDFLERTALDAQLSSDRILQISRKFKSAVSYPKSQLANSLSLVGRMIAGGLATRVYYVNQGGYDTHSGQAPAHQRLMTELSEAVAAFCQDMKGQGNFERVTLLTFSEFGRRVAENGSDGTDHGAAAPLFLAGGGVQPGLFGKYPSLTELNNGDLIHNVDFRSVYFSLLQNWLKAPAEIVLGRRFPILPIV